MVRRLLVFGLSMVLLLTLAGPSGASGQGDTTVIDWNRHATQALVGAGQTPPVMVLHMAMVQAAVFDAVNMIDRGYEPYLDDLPRASRRASKQAAAATAAHHVLVGLGIPPVPPLPAGVITNLNTAYDAAMAAIPDGAAKANGIAAGAAAAAAMLAERTGDGRYVVPAAFTEGTGIGEWRPTGGVNDPFAWVMDVDPFLLRRASQVRTDGPLDIESRAYAREYQEVKDYGSDGTLNPTLRSPEQTATALFFTANPVEMYNRAFRTVAADEGLSLVEQARFFASVNLAGADALIGCWDDKEFWGVRRPITAIQNGDLDGNRRTVGDADWNSLVPSPPYPDHPSGYNCATGSFMNAAKNFFGTNRISFDLVKLATATTPEATRHYTRFTDVVKDTINARIWLGIHFRTPDVQGAELGEEVADYLEDHFLEPRH